MHWIQYIESGPRRVNHAAGALDNYIYSFGGYSNTEDYSRVTPIDIHIFNIHTLKWHPVTKPEPGDPQYFLTPFSRYGHTVVVYQRKFYLWGGRNDHPRACNRLFCFDPLSKQWAIVPSAGKFVPSPRDGHSACVIRNRMYIFGGFEDSTQQFSNQFFYFDFERLSWHLHQPKIGDQMPASRDFHSASNLDNRMYIFGGRFDQLGPEHIPQNVYDDQLYVFDPELSAWLTVTTRGSAPCGRRSHSAFSHNGKLYIFGGFNNLLGSHFNDLHEFDPLSSVWRRIRASGIAEPIPRRRQCCVVIDDRMYMFGGTSPFPSSTMIADYDRTTDHDGNQRLHDQNDLYVLDFAPSLRTLCLFFLAQLRIPYSALPKTLQQDYQLYASSILVRQRSIGANSG